jgi:hypothetical protein
VVRDNDTAFVRETNAQDNTEPSMRSGVATTLVSFGAIFLGFGFSFLVIGLLGVHFGSRPSLGTAGMMALVGFVGGAAMAGGGTALDRRSRN